MKNVVKFISYGLLIILCGQSLLYGMTLSSSRLKALQAMKARGSQLPSRPTQLRQGVSGIDIEPTSPFGSQGQRRTYVPRSESMASRLWGSFSGAGSYVYDLATGNLEARYNTDERKELFQLMRNIKRNIQQGTKLGFWLNTNTMVIDDIIDIIKNKYSSVVNIVWNGTSINSECFDILKVVISGAINKAHTGFFDSRQIYFAFKLCQEIRKLAPQQGFNDKIKLQEIITMLFTFLVDRYHYQGQEELISFADLMEICALVDHLSEVLSVGTRVRSSLVKTGLEIAIGIKPDTSMIDVARIVQSKLENSTGRRKLGIILFKKSVKKMFSKIRQQLIHEADQELLTRLENLMDLSQDELNARSARLLDEMRGKRTFYFTEEGPSEQEWQQKQGQGEQRQQGQERKQRRGGSFSFENEATLDGLKGELKLPTNASNEMTLAFAKKWIRENHPDKFSEEQRDVQDKKFGAFMGKYDKVIDKLNDLVKQEKQAKRQAQQNRE